MKTQQEKYQLRQALGAAHISLSSPRAHSAMRDFKDGLSLEDSLKRAVEDELKARDIWIATALDPWCTRHGLTRAQGLSVAFDDSEFDPCHPEKPRPNMANLFQWGGQQNDFALELLRQEKQVLREFALMCVFDTEIVQYAEQACESIGHIPKFWGVTTDERCQIGKLLANPIFCGHVVTFKTAFECNEAQFTRYSEIFESVAEKCREKTFLLYKTGPQNSGQLRHPFCLVSEGGPAEKVRSTVAKILAESQADNDAQQGETAQTAAPGQPA